RTGLRYRPRTPAPYPVTGVMGAALLVTRACYQAVGGFAAEIEVYYEDVDFCLAARARGFEIVIEPRALVYHDGLRGFAGGLTPWAAFLKARNPWLVVRRRGRAAVWLGFVPTYAAMLGGSAALHALRGRGDVVRALARGALRVDLYHGTKNVLPWRLRVPAVVTVHDLAVYATPETFARAQRWHLRLLVPRAVAAAARVITPSEHARADLLARFGTPPERVAAIPQGVEAAFRAPPPPGAVEQLRALHGLGPRLVASVGTVQPRKPVERVIEAFVRAGAATR